MTGNNQTGEKGLLRQTWDPVNRAGPDKSGIIVKGHPAGPIGETPCTQAEVVTGVCKPGETREQKFFRDVQDLQRDNGVKALEYL